MARPNGLPSEKPRAIQLAKLCAKTNGRLRLAENNPLLRLLIENHLQLQRGTLRDSCRTWRRQDPEGFAEYMSALQARAGL